MGKVETPETLADPFAKIANGELVDKYAKLKADRSKLSADFKKKDTPLKEEQDAIEAELIRRLDAEKSLGSRGRLGSVSINETDVPVIKDIETFARWALKTKNTHLFMAKCVSSPAWREVVQLNPKHTPPPGTESFTVRSLNFAKSTAK